MRSRILRAVHTARRASNIDVLLRGDLPDLDAMQSLPFSITGSIALPINDSKYNADGKAIDLQHDLAHRGCSLY